MKNIQSLSCAYINGQWHEAQDKALFEVEDPALGVCITRVANAGIYESQLAIKAASEALPAWSAQTAKERSSILRRWHEAILDEEQFLAELLSTEQGKPLAEAKAEIRYGAAFIEWFAEEVKRVYGDIIPAPNRSQRISVNKQPIGVVAAITPWNFPNAMITRKVAPALAAGCTIIVKPAPETPLSALALAQLSADAGVPAGVLNVLPTARAPEVVEALMQSSIVRKVSFTGSTHVGKIIASQCVQTLKKVSLELGGNAPLIVFDDADIDLAIRGVIAGKFRNAGQTCVAVNRIFVQVGIYDRFIQKLRAEMEKLILGIWSDAHVTTGPLITKKAQNRVRSLVQGAIESGARMVAQARCEYNEGYFVPPTLLADVSPDMAIAQEEVFGPVASVIPFKEDDEAIRLANDTPYGLAAYFYSENIRRITHVSEALEYGMVGINETAISTEVAPFGGIKESGAGREGSKYGLDEYLELKYLCLGNQ